MGIIRKNQIFGNYKKKYFLLNFFNLDKYENLGKYEDLWNLNNIIYIINYDCVYAIFMKFKNINLAYKWKEMLIG